MLPFLLVFHYPSLPDGCHRARAFRLGLRGGRVMPEAFTKLPTQISGLCLHGSHSLVTSHCALFVIHFSNVTHLFQLRPSSRSAGRAGSLYLQSTGEKTSEFRSKMLITSQKIFLCNWKPWDLGACSATGSGGTSEQRS